MYLLSLPIPPYFQPPVATTNSLSVLWFCLFYTFHINGIFKYLAFLCLAGSFTWHGALRVQPCRSVRASVLSVAERCAVWVATLRLFVRRWPLGRSAFWLSWAVLLCTLMGGVLGGHAFSFLLGTYLGVEFWVLC